jgi:Lar family restriction alleviation protein
MEPEIEWDLLPCPFCGAHPVSLDEYDEGWDGENVNMSYCRKIECRHCRMASTGWDDTKTLEELTAQWNRRIKPSGFSRLEA